MDQREALLAVGVEGRRFRRNDEHQLAAMARRFLRGADRDEPHQEEIGQDERGGDPPRHAVIPGISSE